MTRLPRAVCAGRAVAFGGAWEGHDERRGRSGAGRGCSRRLSSGCRASSLYSAACYRCASRYWSLCSVSGRWLKGVPWAEAVAGVFGVSLGPINGDFEMVQMATAISIFAFLPYTQVRRGNIVVDTFTTKLPPRLNARIDAFWDLVYAGMMALLTACLVAGTLEHYRSGQTTMLLQMHRMAGDCASAPRFGSCLRASPWRRRPGWLGDDHERPCRRRPRLWRDAAAHRRAHARGPLDAGGGVHRLHPSFELAGVLRLHENQPLPSVCELHAVRHSAVHPDGRSCRAVGHFARRSSRPRRPSRATSAAGWRWR